MNNMSIIKGVPYIYVCIDYEANMFKSFKIGQLLTSQSTQKTSFFVVLEIEFENAKSGKYGDTRFMPVTDDASHQNLIKINIDMLK